MHDGREKKRDGGGGGDDDDRDVNRGNGIESVCIFRERRHPRERGAERERDNGCVCTKRSHKTIPKQATTTNDER